jgi:hypothetical protein
LHASREWVEMRGVIPDRGESSRPLRSAAGVLPWLLGVGMTAVYLLTLNHWVAPESLELVANVSGLSPRLELFGPVTYLVTWPFRWLPPAWVPLALNLFSAACAALSLAWLARQKNTNAAIKYIELYQSSSPPNLLDTGLVDYIFAELRGPSVGVGKP